MGTVPHGPTPAENLSLGLCLLSSQESPGYIFVANQSFGFSGCVHLEKCINKWQSHLEVTKPVIMLKFGFRCYTGGGHYKHAVPAVGGC